MTLSIVDLVRAVIPSDFVAKLYSLAKQLPTLGPPTGGATTLATTSFEPGDPTRTAFATHGEVLAQAFGVSTTLGGRNSSPGGGGDAISEDGTLVSFIKGGLLKFASDVTPDPSVARADGSFPTVGTGYLDVVADQLFNVQRSGSVDGNGGVGVTTNAQLVALCIAKITPLGPLFAAPPAGSSSSQNLDPYVYFATDITAGGAYAGAALTAPMTRAQPVISSGLVTLYLANAAGVPPDADAQAEHDYLQQACVPNAITLTVKKAVGVAVAVTLDVYVPTRNASQATTDVQNAVTAFFSQVPIGGAPGAGVSFGVPLNALIGSIFKQLSYVQDIENAKLNGVATDVVLSPGQVALPIPSAVVNVITTG